MSTPRRSKYIRPAADQRKPIKRFDKRDWTLLRLFNNRYDYLWASTISILLERRLHSVQQRLQAFHHNGLLGRWFPDQPYGGGSTAAVYFLDQVGARMLSESEGKPILPKRLDVDVPHPFLMHNVYTTQFMAYIDRAVANYPGLTIPYHFADGQFVDSFRAQRRTITDGREVKRTVWYSVRPDFAWAFDGGRDTDNNLLGRRNFKLEFQRSNRAIKDPKRRRSAYKSVRHKLEGHFYFARNERWKDWPDSVKEKYNDIKEPQNERVLFVTQGMSRQEHANLIDLTRSLDEQGRGLKQFLFTRFEDLEGAPERCTADDLAKVGVMLENADLPRLHCMQCDKAWQPKRLKSGGLPKDYWKCRNYQTQCNHPNPAKRIAEAIWRTPIVGDPPRSIFTSR